MLALSFVQVYAFEAVDIEQTEITEADVRAQQTALVSPIANIDGGVIALFAGPARVAAFPTSSRDGPGQKGREWSSSRGSRSVRRAARV